MKALLACLFLCSLIASSFTHGSFAGLRDFPGRVLKALSKEGYEKQGECKGDYRPLKIYFDTTDLAKKFSKERVYFYERHAFPAVAAWIEDLLRVCDDRDKIVPHIQKTFKTDVAFYSQYIAKTLPPGYDFYMRVFWTADDGGMIASAGPLDSMYHPDSSRPIAGQCGIATYGDEYLQKNKAQEFSDAVATLVHESFHAFFFLEPTFLNFMPREFIYKEPKGKYNGVYYHFQGPKTMEKAREYYKCTPKGEKETGHKFLGPLLEVMGDGALGSHWSEELLDDEFMTPASNAHSEMLGPMTLAMAEDTKWYKANWDMVEKWFAGHGRGCHLVDEVPKTEKNKAKARKLRRQICNDKKLKCPKLGKDLPFSHTGFGKCVKDNQGCKVINPWSNVNCMDSRSFAKTDNGHYGMSFNSKSALIHGTIYHVKHDEATKVDKGCYPVVCSKNKKTGKTQYKVLFKDYTFNRDNTGYTMKDLMVTCTKKGKKDFNKIKGWHKSHIRCHDPAKFCSERFPDTIWSLTLQENQCQEGCYANGRCLKNGKCWCYASGEVKDDCKRKLDTTTHVKL